MISTCYIFSPLFLLHWFSQVVTNFTFTPETFVMLLLFMFLPSIAAKKLLVENVEHKVEQFFFVSIRGDVQLGRFILLSVPTSQQLPLFTSLLFSNDCWNLTAPFLDNSQEFLNNWSLLKAGIYCLTSNKLQSILHASWTRVSYTIIFATSIECPDSQTLTAENTSFTTF